MEIQGYDNALKELEQYPTKINKVVKTSLKKAIAPTVREIKQSCPNKNFARLVKQKTMKGKMPAVIFGLFGKMGDSDKIGSWFKVAYWLNYGTLAKRYRMHVFSTPLRNTHARGGINARLFYDKTVEGKEQTTYNEFIKILKEEVAKLDI